MVNLLLSAWFFMSPVMYPIAFVEQVAERFAAMRRGAGPEVDIAIDFHGAISPQTSVTTIGKSTRAFLDTPRLL